MIVAAYSQIARDEQQHAALAFRFLRWALEQNGELVSERIAQAISQSASPAANATVAPILRALLAAQPARRAA